jgi:hypothetical protein
MTDTRTLTHYAVTDYLSLCNVEYYEGSTVERNVTCPACVAALLEQTRAADERTRAAWAAARLQVSQGSWLADMPPALGLIRPLHPEDDVCTFVGCTEWAVSSLDVRSFGSWSRHLLCEPHLLVVRDACIAGRTS